MFLAHHDSPTYELNTCRGTVKYGYYEDLSIHYHRVVQHTKACKKFNERYSRQFEEIYPGDCNLV